MPIILIPFAVDTVMGIALWQCESVLALKICLTIALVMKFSVFFYSALIAHTDNRRKVGIFFCGILNLILIVYGVIIKQLTLSIGCAIILALLIVWSTLVVFDLKKKKGEQQ